MEWLPWVLAYVAGCCWASLVYDKEAQTLVAWPPAFCIVVLAFTVLGIVIAFVEVLLRVISLGGYGINDLD